LHSTQSFIGPSFSRLAISSEPMPPRIRS
jgi:hypothetical protein